MHWALTRHDPQGWLLRDDPRLIATNDGAFKRDLDRYKYPERHGADALAHRGSGLDFLVEIDRRLAAAGQLRGATPGLVDAAIMPFVRQFAAVDRNWFVRQDMPHLHTSLNGHLASTLFHAIMTRLPPWSPGDPKVLSPL